MLAKRILAVDDDRPILQLLRSVGEICGIEVTATADPAHFLAQLKDNPPDIIFLDLIMPQFDGVEVLRALVAEKIEAKIFLMSGSSKDLLERSEALARSWGLNIAGAIAKPLDPVDLQCRILQAFAGEDGATQD